MQTELKQNVLCIHILRVNLKSLVAEARIIREETKRAGHPYKERLILHRRTRLRDEARLTHLALAYVRGRKYSSVEGAGSKEVPLPLLQRKLVRYGIVGMKDLNEWVRG